jgi:hypothetical protein
VRIAAGDTILTDTPTQVAADIRVDTDLLGTAAVDDSNRDDLRVLGALPPQTFRQSQLWRHQLGEAATRLGEDTTRWGAPVPRCTAEEMVLHLILRRAAVADTGSPANPACAWPDSTDPRGWGDLFEFLFQDHDVLSSTTCQPRTPSPRPAPSISTLPAGSPSSASPTRPRPAHLTGPQHYWP